MEHLDGQQVNPNSLEEALNHIGDGGDLFVHTYVKNIIITQKTLEKFQKAGAWLLKEEGNGYRLQTGKSSIYLFPGQLKYMNCKTPMAY